MSKKEEQSKAYIKPIILDRNKKYLKEDNWELGLEYTDFTGYEVQCAFKSGWDSAIKCLHTSKGYPIDLNGNIKSYDEALKDVKIFNKKMREKLVEKIIEYLYIKCSEGEIEVRNMESLIADLKIKMEELL